MKVRMKWYNDNPDAVSDKTDELLSKMKDLKDDMVENIESLLQRSDKIEVIMEKSERLSSVS